MTYTDITVLIPGHSLEDFPTELGDQPAEGLLNAFAVAWHPLLLAMGESLPKWARADEPLEVGPNRLVIIPPSCQSLVPSAWIDRARREGMIVLTDLTERPRLVAAALEPLGEQPQVDSELVADFHALGHAWLQTELLTRHMRQFGNIDEDHLGREAVSAAKLAVAGAADTARVHLTHCFEMLLEARERFYPVNCHLLELCLLIPRLADQHLEAMLADPTHVNLLASVEALAEVCREKPQLHALIRERWQAGTLDVIGGTWREDCITLLSLESVLHGLHRGRRTLLELFGRSATTWGRRRYGVGGHLPQLLKRLGYESALHFVMDDGIYPDEEFSKLDWQGCDGTSIPAFSRLPLAADSASAILRFPVRMSESMDHDHVAGLIFARWPEVRGPWLEDFRRAAKYSPALGKFTTFAEFFSETDFDGRMAEFRQGTYLSPFLVQSVAARERSPLSRYLRYWEAQRKVDVTDWCAGVADLLTSGRIDAARSQALRDCFDDAGPDTATQADRQEAFAAQLEEESQTASRRLEKTLLTGGQAGRGLLVINPCSFARKVSVEWPEEFPLPAGEPPVAGRQFDSLYRRVLVDVPPCGYAWVDGTANAPAPAASKVPTAEDMLVRNEFFEVTVSEATGGIAQVRTYGRGGNRLSQQLAWRFPREKTVVRNDESSRTWYTEMRRRESRILSAGPLVGSIESVGELVDPSNGQVLCTYRQIVSVCRGRPFIDVEVELAMEKTPTGDPWTNYVASRFAWNDSSLTLSRSQYESVTEVGQEQRLESPNFVELADESRRITLLPRGLSFHRRIDSRMLDTLLVTEGEQERRFRFSIAIDHEFPAQAALDVESPVVCRVTDSAPDAARRMAWLFQVSAKNIQLRRLLPLAGAADRPETGCIVRLQETEGRNRNFKLAAFRPIETARQVDFRGERLHEFRVEDGVVLASIAPYELCDIEIVFQQA